MDTVFSPRRTRFHGLSVLPSRLPGPSTSLPCSPLFHPSFGTQVEHPDGSADVVLRREYWDFNHQMGRSYMGFGWEKETRIKAGDRVVVRCSYDAMDRSNETRYDFIHHALGQGNGKGEVMCRREGLPYTERPYGSHEPQRAFVINGPQSALLCQIG